MVDRHAAAVRVDQAADHAGNRGVRMFAAAEAVALAVGKEAVALVERARAEGRSGRAHVEVGDDPAVVAEEGMVFGVGRLEDVVGHAREAERPLGERQLLALLRRQLVRPGADDLRPVEGAVRALALHHHSWWT